MSSHISGSGLDSHTAIMLGTPEGWDPSRTWGKKMASGGSNLSTRSVSVYLPLTSSLAVLLL